MLTEYFIAEFRVFKLKVWQILAISASSSLFVPKFEFLSENAFKGVNFVRMRWGAFRGGGQAGGGEG